MLYALGAPLNFLALLTGFGLALLARGVAQAAMTRALGYREFALRARLRPDIRRHGDIYGLIAALLGGTGWGRAAPIDTLLGRYRYGRARGRPAVHTAVVLLCGPLAAALVGVVGILAARAAGAPALLIHATTPSDAVHGDLLPLDLGPRLLLLGGVAALAVGVLAIVPIPPLDGGTLLFALAPITPGWQRARNYAEANWGLGVLLVLVILPLGPRRPVLLAVVDAIGRPLLHLLGHQ